MKTYNRFQSHSKSGLFFFLKFDVGTTVYTNGITRNFVSIRFITLKYRVLSTGTVLISVRISLNKKSPPKSSVAYSIIV